MFNPLCWDIRNKLTFSLSWSWDVIRATFSFFKFFLEKLKLLFKFRIIYLVIEANIWARRMSIINHEIFAVYQSKVFSIIYVLDLCLIVLFLLLESFWVILVTVFDVQILLSQFFKVYQFLVLTFKKFCLQGFYNTFSVIDRYKVIPVSHIHIRVIFIN